MHPLLFGGLTANPRASVCLPFIHTPVAAKQTREAGVRLRVVYRSRESCFLVCWDDEFVSDSAAARDKQEQERSSPDAANRKRFDSSHQRRVQEM